MKRFTAVLVLSLAASAAEVPSSLEWRDSARDVWIDGTLDRDAQVLSCADTKKLALLSPRLARAAVVDVEGKSVASAEKSAFTFAKSRASATTPRDLATAPLCTCAVVDPSTFLMSLEGKSVLIARHQGAVGEIGEEALFSTVPVWRSLMESYTPDATAVAALAKEPSGAEITVVLGTWCGDSKNYVPKLLRSLHEAGNPRLKVKLVGLASRFLDPMELIQERRIINVPTVIVERGGRELGRIVETPAGASVEADLAAILAGAASAHPGRWERKEKLASGTYTHVDVAGRRVATEAWELYSAPEDGLLLHSAISGADEVEVWHSVNRERRLDVLEVTKRKDGRLERARWFRDGKRLLGHLRGNDSGIVDQTVAVPESVALLSPATLAEGWAAAAAEGAQAAALYDAAGEMERPLGVLRAVRSVRRESGSATVPAGTFAAERVTLETDDGACECWMTKEGAAPSIPVRLRRADGSEVVLASLEGSYPGGGPPAKR
jgi:hypothetical protein